MIRRKGFTLIELLVVVAIIALLIAILLPSLAKAREQAKRSTCASNMKQVYTAMYEYSGDNKGTFPKVSVKSSSGNLQTNLQLMVLDTGLPSQGWVNTLKGKEDPVVPDIDNLDNTPPGNVYFGVSHNLWQLVRGDFAEANIFRCPSDPGNKNWEFDMTDVDGSNGGTGPQYFWTFPFKDYDVAGAVKASLSYSYIQPWSIYGDGRTSGDAWRPDVDARVVIGADQNNGGVEASYAGGDNPTWRESDGGVPNYGNMKKYVNSRNHQQEGQNVLFGDGHIRFERSAYVGVNGDNIYTSRSSTNDGTNETVEADTDIPEATGGSLRITPKKIHRTSENYDTVLIPTEFGFHHATTHLLFGGWAGMSTTWRSN